MLLFGVFIFILSAAAFIFGLKILKNEIENTEFLNGFLCASCIFAGAPFVRLVYTFFKALVTGGAE